MIKAKIVLDSIGENGSAPRLTTWELTIPRFVLAELNTHRKFSRNCPSSRAIPVLKRIGMVWHNPVEIVHWGMDKPGMQAGAEAKGLRRFLAKSTWRAASLLAAGCAYVMVKLGVAKQVANRILEPFVEVTDLVTATQDGMENWFALRADAMADPHIQALAYQMLDAYNRSIPTVLKPGEWHVPYGDMMPDGLTWDEKVKIAVARCARVSYNQFDGSSDVTKDFALHDRLAASGHWSSFEHIAKVPEPKDQFHGVSAPGIPSEELAHLHKAVTDVIADPDGGAIVTNYDYDWTRLLTPSLSGNLTGWVQLRKTYPNECRRDSRIVDWSDPDYRTLLHATAELKSAGYALTFSRPRVVRSEGYVEVWAHLLQHLDDAAYSINARLEYGTGQDYNAVLHALRLSIFHIFHINMGLTSEPK